MENEPKIFGDVKVSKPVTVSINMMRVVKPKKTTDEVCKKKNNLVEARKEKALNQ